MPTPKATNPATKKKPAGGKGKPAGGKDTEQPKFPEAKKTEQLGAVKSWKQGIESKYVQVRALRILIDRMTRVSVEFVRIGQELNRFGNPMNDAIDDLKIDKKTEKAIESQGSAIGAMTQAVGIIEEKIARDLDNPPDTVSAPELKKLRKKYYPDDKSQSVYPELDASPDSPDSPKPDKPAEPKKKKAGEAKDKKTATKK